MPIPLRPIVMLGFAASFVPVFAQKAKTSEPSPTAIPRFEDLRVPSPIAHRNGPAGVATHVPDPENEILETAREGPNFAGQFVVEQFSCGSGCTSFVIANVKTLKVLSNNFNVAYSFCSASYKPGSELEYRIDSRLLIVNGAIETLDRTKGEVDGPCGHFYYLWNGHSLNRIYSVVPAAQAVRH